ncbi:MAG: glycosyltransferase family 4 protein [Candidatus Aminicenantia bacterium]
MARKPKVAFVVQRYGIEVTGGAELLCRWVAERMREYWDIEVLTSCAIDYVTWKNHYPEGITEVNGIPVRRFRVKRERDVEKFGRIQEKIFGREHTIEDELNWIEENGPYYPELIEWIKKNKRMYDFFVFFSYRYFHSFFGIKEVGKKSILIPTAEHDDVLYMRAFRDTFNNTGGIAYISLEEAELVQKIMKNYQIPYEIIGVGVEVLNGDGKRFRVKFNIDGKFILYVGRIDENKGCVELFDFFSRFLRETKAKLKLVLAGYSVMKIPDSKEIVYLGVISDQEKFDALSACEVFVMPSFYESLSIISLEAFASGKPVLANGNCEVLKGHIERSNGGLFYLNYEEFREALSFLLREREIAEEMGRGGKEYFENTYKWGIIEEKYLRLAEKIL